MWKIIIFILFTFFLIYISRASLLKPHSHGFYRFFAWECMLILFLLNIDYWFIHPFTWNQIVSWILLFICIVPLVLGVQSLTSHGKSISKRADDESLLSFEKTTQLVTTGIYKYIRHPLYSSLLLLTWGIFFKFISLAGGMFAVFSTIFLFLTAKADEAECVHFFGSAYSEYMSKTKRFIPYIF